MTPDPYQRHLNALAAQRERGPADADAEFWRGQAVQLAKVADEMLAEWRKLYRQIHHDADGD